MHPVAESQCSWHVEIVKPYVHGLCLGQPARLTRNGTQPSQGHPIAAKVDCDHPTRFYGLDNVHLPDSGVQCRKNSILILSLMQIDFWRAF